MALAFPNSPLVGDQYTASGNTWQWNGTTWDIVISGGGGGGGGSSLSFATIAVSGQDSVSADSGADTLTLVAGSGMTITTSASTDTVTLTSSGGGASGNIFSTISTDTGANVVADASADTLTIAGGVNIQSVGDAALDKITLDMTAFSIDFLSDVDTVTTAPTTGQVLKWNGSNWAPGVDSTTGGAGTDADTLDGFDSSYYLNYNNLSNKPSLLQLTALSVGSAATASGNGAINYNNVTGVFTFTPPDLTSYITGVAWNDITSKPTTTSGFGITDAFDGAYTSLTGRPTVPTNNNQLVNGAGFITGISSLSVDALSDVDTTTAAPSSGQVLKWDGANWVPSASGGGGDANQNAFSTIAVAGQSDVVADSTTDTLTLTAGTNITLTTNASGDSVTITGSGGGATDFDDLGDVTSAGLKVSDVYLPAITQLVVGASGTSAYTFDQYGGNNPTIYAISGTTIAFNLQGVSASHPFQIQDPTSAAYNTGLVHVTDSGTVTSGASANSKTGGILYWKVPAGISGGYRYQCTNHGAMVGSITIKSFATL
jgi:hypothetical protein|tara:strand:+ start:40 stop:1668 length:1629 start_codon:yes stop_codon:yes gene_type:complete